MHQAKLITLLKTLSDKELRWFERYLHSSFFNVNEDVRGLFLILQKYHPTYDNPKLKAEKIFAKLFPKAIFSKQKLKYVVSDTTVLLEDYLAFVEYKRQDFYQHHFLLEAYHNRQIDKYFTESLQHYSKERETEIIRDSTYFFEQYQINELMYIHITSQQGRSSPLVLQQTTDNLDVFYLSAKLKYCCEIINKQNIVSADYHISMFDELLNHLKKSTYEHIPAITVYYRILMSLLESENEEHYLELIQLLDKNANHFKQAEQKDMYAFAQNYCIKKINGGQSLYLREIFKLYQTLLETGILIQNEMLSQWDYKNIVVAGLRLGEYAWVEDFIHSYKEKIMLKDRENAYSYNLAYFHFYKKDYRKALRLLQSVEFTDIYYQLDSKALLLKTYYEADALEPLLSMIESFAAFLKRNHLLSEYQNKAYSNLVKFVQYLVDFKYEQKGEIEAIRKQITQLSPIADVSWLLKSVDKLANE